MPLVNRKWPGMMVQKNRSYSTSGHPTVTGVSGGRVEFVALQESQFGVTSATDITHIVSTPGIRGGKPRIRGHRIAVHDIAVYVGQGMCPEEIAETYRLTLGEVHAALSYYYDHRDRIDREIVAEAEEIRRLGQADHSPVAERVRNARRESGIG
jgi:uncharacterized protein (DUF433 family)